MNYNIIGNYYIASELLEYVGSLYKKDLENLRQTNLVDNDLGNIIDIRLSKYKQRLASDHKVKIKKISPIYEDWKQSIQEYLQSIHGNITKEHIQQIHKLFFPKAYFGETMGENGVRYYKQYPAGIIRDHEESVIVGNMQYFYIQPRYINTSIDNILTWFNTNSQTDIFIKIIVLYIYICEIHPFANGNGTVALLLCDTLLYKHGIDFSITKFINNLSTEEMLQFFKEGMKGNYELVFKKVFQ